jgi:putative hydrolase of the HAD superfamily
LSAVISAVLFDLDETLLNRTASVTAFLGDQYQRFVDDLGAVALDIWRSRFLALDQKGRVPKSVVYPALLKEFGGNAARASALLEDYKQRCCRYAQPFPGMRETLTDLREHGLKLGIVTNGEVAIQTPNINALELPALVDAILISEHEGLRKPDVVLFHRAAERLAVRPEQCLFVGDSPEADIVGAHCAGMITAWFDQKGDWVISTPRPHHIIKRLSEISALVRLEF